VKAREGLALASNPSELCLCPHCKKYNPESFATYICGVCSKAFDVKDPKKDPNKDGQPAPQTCPNPNCSNKGKTAWPPVSFSCAVCNIVTGF
jgi:hypothetical protein